jgi:NTP pyrophosphatase (non-canonical NTP hydrolase)
MITQDDIDAMGMSYYEPYTAQDYSLWVEDKIVTEGHTRLVENVLGLVGEAGEVAEKIKKQIRDGSRVSNEEIVKELGDVVFYATALANYLGYDLQEVLDRNIDKLDSREARGVIKGSGDNR